MSEFNTVTNNEFMIEKIKERPINRKRLLKKTLITASMAVMFGLVACVTILILEPVISNLLYPEEDTEIEVNFPEDEEEMEPEEMLADKVYEEEPISTELNREQVEKILEAVTLDKTHYLQLYDVMSEYVKNLYKYMVSITGIKSDYNWLEDSYEKISEATGAIIANDGEQILILASLSAIKSADVMHVTLYNGATANAKLLQKDGETSVAVLSVEIKDLGMEEEAKRIDVASLGSSRLSNLVGSPVVAVGSPMGIANSIGYGMITSKSAEVMKVDFTYNVLTTDIYGSKTAQGFLFNLQGQIVGIITPEEIVSDMENMISAYGISDVKPLINTLSEGDPIAYLGIKGIDVTEEANAESGIPYGAYVKEVVMNSPAMMAGLQKGDIIIRMNDTVIEEFQDYERVMYSMESGQTVKIKVMRLSQGEYKEMDLDAVLKGAR